MVSQDKDEDKEQREPVNEVMTSMETMTLRCLQAFQTQTSSKHWDYKALDSGAACAEYRPRSHQCRSGA